MMKDYYSSHPSAPSRANRSGYDSPHNSRYSEFNQDDDPDNASKRQEELSQCDSSRNHEDMVPISLLTYFQEALGNKFTEMLSFHKELISEYNKRDTIREEKIRKLVDDIADLSKRNSQLQVENQKMRQVLMENRHT
ncbi:unnamed protein product [Blepharisma stoltei]|uniref:Uncharacterized protein n=1 Tax=Blepharisma stoltei TaxID=1481888 RepID=A0AAU9IL94_9CILI|nr:unnamed protein product [Blepharisma stoltei]